MNPKRVKLDENETAKVDDPLLEDHPIQKFPTELLRILIDWVKNAHTKRKARNQQLADLRLVSKLWQNVIDSHLDYKPKISDKIINGKYLMDHVRATKVGVAELTIPLNVNQIPKLCNPELITEVKFGKSVSKDAFLTITQYFGEIGKVNSVQITKGFLDCNVVLVDVDYLTCSVFKSFFEQVTKLDLQIPFSDLTIRGWKHNRDLINIMKRAKIPKLTNLKLTGHWRLLITHLPISFLLRHPNLQQVHLSLEPYFLHTPEGLLHFLPEAEIAQVESMYLNSSDQQITFRDYEKMQLKSITVEGPSMCHIVRETWMQVILAQKKLAQLKLSHLNETFSVDKSVMVPMPFVDFIPVLNRNINTLTCLELRNFQFGKTIDFEIFQGLKQLKTLKLQKKDNGLVTRIVNITSLPESLEYLAINGFGTRTYPLKQLAKASHLKNLRDVESVFLRHVFSNIPRPIPDDVALAFIEKGSKFCLHLKSLSVSLAHGSSKEIGEYPRYLVTFPGSGKFLQHHFATLMFLQNSD